MDNDTDAIVADISFDDETLPVTSLDGSKRPPVNEAKPRPRPRPDVSLDDKTIPGTSLGLSKKLPINGDGRSLLNKSIPPQLQENELSESRIIDLEAIPNQTTDNSLERPTQRQCGSSKVSPKATDFNDEEELIEPVEIQHMEHSVDDIFKEMKTLPPTPCDVCGKTRKINKEGVESCTTCTTFDFVNQSINQLPESTLLTESESESDNYSEQETSHLKLGKRVKPPPSAYSESDQVNKLLLSVPYIPSLNLKHS